MSVFLDACHRKPTPYTPIWIMRQAGRYQAEYRALRARYDFVQMCKTPAIATEVTLLPIDQLGVDAAIVFADILLLLEPLGVGFEFTKNDGPRIERPLRSPKDIDRVADEVDAAAALDYVMATVRGVRKELDGRVPVIGFAAAPFTLASYMIEGGGSKDYLATKHLMFSDRGAWDALMDKLTRATAGYMKAQVDAGAQALQVFDSWVGCLAPQDYKTYIQPHMRRLFDALGDRVPVIHFGTGNPTLYPLMRDAGGHVIGVDWRVDLRTQWDALGPDVAIMGNLDPGSLLSPLDTLRARAKAVLAAAGGQPGHVFNLGHGIFPSADPNMARALVEIVHEESAR